MRTHHAAGALILNLAAATGGAAQERPLPVIDMHLHAALAASQGPPPLAMCTPLALPPRDPSRPWPDAFMHVLKQPACDDPVWSPATDAELMRRTLDILERRNMIGVTSGRFDFVRHWRQAAPERIVPGLSLTVGPDAPSPDSIARWHARGDLAVLGEIGNQYIGMEPDHPDFEPYLAIAEQLDIPVGIRIGTGPPGAPYLGSAATAPACTARSPSRSRC